MSRSKVAETAKVTSQEKDTYMHRYPNGFKPMKPVFPESLGSEF